MLERAGLAADMPRLGYAPHLTLWDGDGAPQAPDTVTPALDAVATRHAAPRTAFGGGLGVFPGPPAVLWLAPGLDPALAALHAAVDAAMAPLPCQAHDRPGAWTPHVTLSAALHGLAGATGALAAVALHLRPFAARLDRLDLVRFPPVEILWSAALAPPGG